MLRACIRRLAEAIVVSPRRINRDAIDEPRRAHLVTKHSFSRRAAADVAHTDEENFHAALPDVS